MIQIAYVNVFVSDLDRAIRYRVRPARRVLRGGCCRAVSPGRTAHTGSSEALLSDEHGVNT
jgi:hypothetical protein